MPSLSQQITSSCTGLINGALLPSAAGTTYDFSNRGDFASVQDTFGHDIFSTKRQPKMNEKPSLEDLGLDAPMPSSPTKKSIEQIANEIDTAPANMTTCRKCGRAIHVDSALCAFCKNPVVTKRQPQYQKQPWNGVAAVLSFLFPGLGQLYKGEVGRAIVFFILTLMGYVFFIVPGLVFHVVVIVDAGSQIKRLF